MRRASGSSTACPCSSPARTTGTGASTRPGLPIIGDDIKSQVGATIVHRQLARLFHDRGVRLERTSQLNVGGNMDFYNMLERERLASKKESKTNAVTSIIGHELPADDVHVGPSDYVAWLTDRKWAHIRLEGRSFGDVPLNLEMKLEVWDSPNSAGIVIDAMRIVKLALNNGIAGELDGPSSYLMKSPHTQRPDDEARELTEEFIRAARAQARRPARLRAQDRGVDRAGRARRSTGSSAGLALLSCGGGPRAPVDRPGEPPPVGSATRGERVRRGVSAGLAERGHRVVVAAPPPRGRRSASRAV